MEDDDEKYRDNVAPRPKPPGLSLGGYAPAGSLGINPAPGKSDLVSGPYFILNTDPNTLIGAIPASSPSPGAPPPPEQPPLDTRVAFLQTGDKAVDDFYSQEYRMIGLLTHDQPETPAHDPELDSILAEASQTPPHEEQPDPVIDLLHAEAMRDEADFPEPDSDLFYARDAEQQGRDTQDAPDLSEDFNERSLGPGR